MKYIVSFLILFLVSTTSAQVNISGKITNEKGELLDFVTVFFENTTYAASTDAKGQYTIRDVKSGDYMLKAIYLGYPSIIIPITIIKDTIVNLIFEGEIYSLDAIEIQANRIGEYGPFTRQNIGRSELNKYNTGQDATFLLQWTPSMVVTSDAGTGMGYSGLRL
nr:carboxypeptidase-like regulatory domain-containing protein [Saprospiraceae bacterium]